MTNNVKGGGTSQSKERGSKSSVLDMLDIIGTETQLNNEVKNSELFPAEFYEVEREDRQDDHGGVLLAVKKDVNPQKISMGENISQKEKFSHDVPIQTTKGFCFNNRP